MADNEKVQEQGRSADDDAPAEQRAPDDSSPVDILGPRLPTPQNPGLTDSPPAGAPSVMDPDNPDVAGRNSTVDVTRPPKSSTQGVGSPNNCGSED
jgi:hypothetical protein